MTSEQVIAVQRKFYEMAGMNGELCQEGLDRLASGFGRYGYESHKECSDEEWRREVREELHDAFVMMTGLEQSRTANGGAVHARALQNGKPPGRPGGDPLGMVVGVVLKHLKGGFGPTFVEEMVRVLGELSAQDGHEMLELAHALGYRKVLVDISVGSFPPEQPTDLRRIMEERRRGLISTDEARERAGLRHLVVEDALAGEGGARS